MTHIELVVTRDPDGYDEVDVFVDGVRIDRVDGFTCSEYSIDAGAGYDWNDWVDGKADNAAQASPGVAALLREVALDPPGDEYIDDMPDNEDERVLQFDRAVREYKRFYAKQAACKHENTEGGLHKGYRCLDCRKYLPWPTHEFNGTFEPNPDYCMTCGRSRKGGNHENG